MGSSWIDIPKDLGNTVTITGELTSSDLQGLLTLLKSASQSGTFCQARSDTKTAAIKEVLVPLPTPPDTQVPSTKQIYLEKLSAGLKQQVPSAPPCPEQGAEPAYQEIWRTEPENHEASPVNAIAYIPHLDGLHTAPKHSGWLVSSSKNLLNLWECASLDMSSPLQLMHSQMTEFSMSDIQLDGTNKVVLAVAQETEGEQTECFSLHSLDAQAGMFTPSGTWPFPPPGVQQMPSGFKHRPQVQSLHGLGGPLKACAAVSYGQHIAIYPTKSIILASPKAVWQAHGACVTKLHCSTFSVDLYSGAEDGSVKRWNLKDKPRTAAAAFLGLSAKVVGVHQISKDRLLAASEDGNACIWTLSKPEAPLLLIKFPANSSLAGLAVSFEAKVAAVSTVEGSVFTLDLDETSRQYCHPAAVIAQQSVDPVSATAWDTTAGHLYIAMGSTIAVFQGIAKSG